MTIWPKALKKLPKLVQNHANYCIIKDLFFNEIDLLTVDKYKEYILYMISLIG